MPEETAGERTEPATTRKREQVRRKGQVAKSQDLNSTIVLVAVLLAFYLVGGSAFSELYRVFQFHLAIACSMELTPSSMGVVFMNVVIPLAKIVLPFWRSS